MAKVFHHSTPANGALAIFDLKALLKANGYTVQRSSDATTYNAAGDQITVSGSGAGGMANTGAWFVITKSGGGAQPSWCFQRGTTNLVWRVKYSFDGNFTGGSPGATQTPSATDEVIIFGAGTDAAPTYHTMLEAEGTYRFNAMVDNTNGIWWAFNFPTGGGAVSGYLMQDFLNSRHEDDGYGWVARGVRVSNAFNSGELCVDTTSNAASNTHVAYTARAALAAPWVAIKPTALRYVDNALNVIVPSNLSTNPIDSKDQPFPIVMCRRSAVANPGYKGVSSNMMWNSTSRTIGDTLSTFGTRDRIVVGEVSLDWDGTVPTI